jgi:hypothetical protein
MAKKYFNVDLETSGKVVSSVIEPPSSQNVMVKGDKKNLDGDNFYKATMSSNGGSFTSNMSANILLASTDSDYVHNPVSAPAVTTNADAAIVLSAASNFGDTTYTTSYAAISLIAKARSGGADADTVLTVDRNYVHISNPNSSVIPKLKIGGASITYESNDLLLDKDLDLGSKDLKSKGFVGTDITLTDDNADLAAGASISIGPNGGDVNHTSAVIKRTIPDATSAPGIQDLSIGADLGVSERTVVGGKGVEAKKLYSTGITYQYGALASTHIKGQDVTDGGTFSLIGLATDSNHTGQLVTIGNASNIPAYSTTTDNQYTLMYGNDGRLYRGTTAYFSAEHTYVSDGALEVGAAAVLSNNKVIVSQASNESICVGIVSSSRVIDSNTVDNMDSLGNRDAAEGLYRSTVICTGDSRHKGCQGFNVCNENGDIQPGDLLVTSNTPGYLMKQDDDIMRSKTVGKAMEAVTFDDNGQATGVYGFIYCG